MASVNWNRQSRALARGTITMFALFCCQLLINFWELDSRFSSANLGVQRLVPMDSQRNEIPDVAQATCMTAARCLSEECDLLSHPSVKSVLIFPTEDEPHPSGACPHSLLASLRSIPQQWTFSLSFSFSLLGVLIHLAWTLIAMCDERVFRRNLIVAWLTASHFLMLCSSSLLLYRVLTPGDDDPFLYVRVGKIFVAGASIVILIFEQICWNCMRDDLVPSYV